MPRAVRTRTETVIRDPGLAPVDSLPGVGPVLVQALARIAIGHVQDLWFHLPLRYEDRTRVTAMADLRVGETAQVEGTVTAVERGFRFRPQLRVALEEGGRTLTLRFFHFRKAQAEVFVPGTRFRCHGEVRSGAHGLEIVHPQYLRVDADTPLDELLTPIYPTTEGLGQRRLSSLIGHALARLPDEAALELVPTALREPLALLSLRDALRIVHRPPPGSDVAALAQGTHPAQQRLAFEELLTHHLSLKRLREQVRRHAAPRLCGDGHLRDALVAALPFALTGAQQRVDAEIARDLAQVTPMLRLVQGDVGSGKTVLAALAALTAIESGAQAALMAPTELLAEQHLRSLGAWFAPLGITPLWLAGKVQGRARQKALDALADGAPMVIGTHALMQQGVVFRNLGLAIIDEQHRFGVHQRLALRDKGRDVAAPSLDRSGNTGQRSEGLLQVPHQLVLTATPIPRTLAMAAYADLDVSVVDELPPGRKPVKTVAVSAARRGEVIERIRQVFADGRQAYWVCTLIEESEQSEAQAAEVAHAELAAALGGVRIALVHGRMKSAEKQAVMDDFRAGRVTLLVATTVIEVGVDVPNASLMVIENPERLGLAQLHQLRGRVGRGERESTCVLMYQAPLSAMARERLEAMRETNDGFIIAERDLALRGPGEMLGTRQTGRLEFRIADLARDAALLPDVQRLGEILLAQHPECVDRLVARWVGSAAQYAGA
jgi:ATP-dependent DNA helicase RecG